MAIGSWEVIHVAAGYAAILYYIVTRFYFAAEELESSLFGFVSTVLLPPFPPLLSVTPCAACVLWCALANVAACAFVQTVVFVWCTRFVFFVSLVHSSICCNLFSTEENENSKPPPSCCKSRCSVCISTACVLALQWGLLANTLKDGK